MNLEVVATSAVAAGVVSAVCTALFGWVHFRVETREKRWETRTAHLRDAVADFLTASRALYEHEGEEYEAIDDRDAKDAGGSPVYDEAEMNAQIQRFTNLARAAHQATEDALSRIELYSSAIHAKAEVVLRPGLSHQGRRDRAVALAEFLEVARTELRIGGLEDREPRPWWRWPRQ